MNSPLKLGFISSFPVLLRSKRVSGAAPGAACAAGEGHGRPLLELGGAAAPRVGAGGVAALGSGAVDGGGGGDGGGSREGRPV